MKPALGNYWGVGDANLGCKEHERRALIKIKEDLIDDYDHLSSWSTKEGKEDCCKWRGVHCNNQTGHVSHLNLSISDVEPLRGKLSPLLSELQYLTFLDVSYNDFNHTQIPKSIASLSNLRHLDFYHANFGRNIPFQLGNLSSLQHLDLGRNNFNEPENLEWLRPLSSLSFLCMSSVNLSKVNNWLHVVNQLPYLTVLLLHACSLPNIFPIPHVNSSTSLDVLNLSYNNLTLSSSALEWLFNSNITVVKLYLFDNQFQGLIPDAFSKIHSLELVDLDGNEFEGGIPKSFSGMCNLKTLSLSSNNLSEQLLGIFHNLTGCANHSIEELYLDNNHIMGSFPDLTTFSSLRVLLLSHNRLSGTIPESLGKQSNLEILYIGDNLFKGVISEAHFSKLTKLKLFQIYNNTLVVNFSSNWAPPFQLEQLYLVSCQLASGLPKWLQTQKSYYWLDLSNSTISDTLSNSYWIFPTHLHYINLSHNQINGHIPNLALESSFPFAIDLNSNKLEGEIPPFVFKGSHLDLSNNMFSKLALSLCEANNNSLKFLDLSNNHLSGEIPNCWMHFEGLKILKLANNHFHGKIPSSVGSLIKIETLDLGNNNFSGELPSTLKKCTKLIFLDLRNNSLSGPIPMWLGRSHPNLVVLFLRSNQFYGRMPSHLCHLTHLQILDLALNRITESIPRCLNNLTSLTDTKSPNVAINHSYELLSSRYVDQTIWMWKGREYFYRNILALVKGIDLSSNKLSEVIPEEIVMLDGLISLNLSRNLLTGKITSDIKLLRSLEVLDLSDNKLCGEIPSTLSLIDGLNSLNLRNNNLSGRIPTGPQLSTFNASSYEGNPNLCGFPLPKNCLGEETPQNPTVNPTVNGSSGDASMQDEKDGFITRGFYVSAAIGFVVGFWGVFGTLLLNRSWRLSYFKFLNNIRDRLYVIGGVTMARLQRQLQS
uniref:Leucine-rich repeat-containing N-terminal plant-type domain-containing protein n=2 Tax=Quercus lobata TaxID=97700 RepID=A0A7N2MTJ2_QUELO